MTQKKELLKCVDCGKNVTSKSKRCDKCRILRKKLKEKEYKGNNKEIIKEKDKRYQQGYYMKTRGKVPLKIRTLDDRVSKLEKQIGSNSHSA